MKEIYKCVINCPESSIFCNTKLSFLKQSASEEIRCPSLHNSRLVIKFVCKGAKMTESKIIFFAKKARIEKINTAAAERKICPRSTSRCSQKPISASCGGGGAFFVVWCSANVPDLNGQTQFLIYNGKREKTTLFYLSPCLFHHPHSNPF